MHMRCVVMRAWMNASAEPRVPSLSLNHYHLGHVKQSIGVLMAWRCHAGSAHIPATHQLPLDAGIRVRHRLLPAELCHHSVLVGHPKGDRSCEQKGARPFTSIISSTCLPVALPHRKNLTRGAASQLRSQALPNVLLDQYSWNVELQTGNTQGNFQRCGAS